MRIHLYKACLLITCIVCSIIATAQNDSTYIDSLKKVLLKEKEDTNKVKSLLAQFYQDTSEGSSQLLQQALDIARKVSSQKWEARVLTVMGNNYWNISNYPQSLNCYLQALKISEQLNYGNGVSADLGNIGNVYLSMGYFKKSIDYSIKSLAIDRSLNKQADPFNYTTLGEAYAGLGIMDSAFRYAKMGYDSSLIFHYKFYIARAAQGLANIYFKSKNYYEALKYYDTALVYAKPMDYELGLSGTYQSIAEIYKVYGKTDSAVYYSQQALQTAQLGSAIPVEVDAATFLAGIYERTDRSKSAYYLKIALAAKDSLYNNERNGELENIDYNIEQREKDKEAAALQYENNMKFYGALAAFGLIGVVAIILFRNNRQKQKANRLIAQQKEKVESTLSELKSTQSHLIQSEKMASLGELTAGIAHEIQNPLNFVNNFSEVNKELIAEMNEAIDKGNYNEVKVIAKDVADNEDKINHHGKRADAIVKGMLQHSRSSSGQKEPTDINALCDEYLRLSYHGLRAKDKNFNADFKTDFDESIGKINLVPQDIGRVLLNLFNNAFYAVSKPSNSLKGEQYKPFVSITTRKINSPSGAGGIEIIVSDNGNGIPSSIKEKIFQPFFTTKPTGEGTGLGLSLAYDIITKEHNGTLKAESKEGEGSTFIIQL